MKNKYLGFLLLFTLYHAAEWMFMQYQSVAGFLGFQVFFFIAAFVIGNVQFSDGLGGFNWISKPFTFFWVERL